MCTVVSKFCRSCCCCSCCCCVLLFKLFCCSSGVLLSLSMLHQQIKLLSSGDTVFQSQLQHRCLRVCVVSMSFFVLACRISEHHPKFKCLCVFLRICCCVVQRVDGCMFSCLILGVFHTRMLCKSTRVCAHVCAVRARVFEE